MRDCAALVVEDEESVRHLLELIVRFPADTVVLQKPFDIDRIEDALRSFLA